MSIQYNACAFRLSCIPERAVIRDGDDDGDDDDGDDGDKYK